MSTTTQRSEKAEPVVLPVSLRDYFAAKAMHALLATPRADWPFDIGQVSEYSVSQTAYEMADKMLEARGAD